LILLVYFAYIEYYEITNKQVIRKGMLLFCQAYILASQLNLVFVVKMSAVAYGSKLVSWWLNILAFKHSTPCPGKKEAAVF